MTTEEYAKIVSKNLKRIAYEKGKSQVQIARDLGINQATLSAWMNGTRTPKMDKIDLLCDYFKCTRNDIMEPHEYYAQNDLKSIGKITSEDIEIIEAYKSLSEESKALVKAFLGVQKK